MVKWRLSSPCLGTLTILLGILISLARRLEKTRLLKGFVFIHVGFNNKIFIFIMLTRCVSSRFRFHEFLKLETEVGNMTRQEAVSMVCSLMLYHILIEFLCIFVTMQVPPLFLDVHPDHFVLDSE